MSATGKLARRERPSARLPDTWSGVRLRFAGYAATTVALTAAVVLTSPFGGTLAFGVAGYAALVALAIFVPAAITPQVIAGQLMAGVLWLQGGDAAAVSALLVIGSVVATAELLAEVARLDSPLGRRPSGALGRVGAALAIACVVFALLASAGELPGVTGLVGVALGAAVCAWVAVGFVRRLDGPASGIT